jgi:hypothetical protein
MTIWVLRNGKLVDKDAAGPPPSAGNIFGRGPYIQSDIRAYRSMATGQVVDGRRAQREDLKASGCRLADSSEAPKHCHTAKWARRLKLPHEPPPKPQARVTRIGPEV